MFRTEMKISPSQWKITQDDTIFSMGSCFAIHMGDKLKENKFQSLTNPFGTIFNPRSLFQIIKLCLTDEKLAEWSFLENQGIHRNYLFHSDISGIDKSSLEGSIEKTRSITRSFIQQTNVIILTFGTSIYYRLKSNNEVVANCHKIPSANFEKQMLTVEEIMEDFEETYTSLKAIHPHLRFILSVSPVRHIKDTLELNAVSKASLRLAAHQISEIHEDVDYFPSYEIMMDDLRDYRFYKEDMLHPNDQAINYIWEKFVKCYFDEKAINFLEEWGNILKAINHRPFYPNSDEHKQFISKTIKRIEELNRPTLQEEIDLLKKQLHG